MNVIWNVSVLALCGANSVVEVLNVGIVDMYGGIGGEVRMECERVWNVWWSIVGDGAYCVSGLIEE